MLFPPDCLGVDGRVICAESGPSLSSLGAVGYAYGFYPLITTEAVASSDGFANGLRLRSSDGAIRAVDASGGVPANSTVQFGIAFSPSGQMCVNNTAVTSDVFYVNGVPVSRTGVLYVDSSTVSPAAWYRYGVGITVTGSGVSTWADQSGNGRDLRQTTDTNRPALQADGSILFDGVDNFMRASFAMSQPATAYALVNQVTWTSGNYLLAGATAGATRAVFAQVGTTPRITANFGTTLGTITTLDVNTYGVLAAVLNDDSSVIQHNSVTFTGDAGPNTLGGLTLGGDSGSPTAGTFSNVAFKEVILYSAAHDAGTRARVIRYLGQVGQLAI